MLVWEVALALGRQLWKPIENHCCGLGPGVPVGEVALALGCLWRKVFGGFRRFWRVWYLWKPIKSYCCGLGPGVPVGEVVLALGCLLDKVFGRFWRAPGGFGGGFGGWSDRTSFIPAVVLGTAPALAKAGVGGYYDLVWPRARARSFSRLIFPKICYFFGKIGEYKLSLREYKLSLCFLSPLRGGRNFTTILGKSFWCFFGKNSLLPS